ncbi:General transcription and DNA repair factor IIH helicase subunit XPD [Dictyocoela muelleri]|nr:General transcription and DNA repair factor IIH helicase subunit XPD [Dictyocoela muelleri]
MIFEIDNLKIYFPYDYIYPEQYKYMTEVKHLLDNYGHAILEMPSGTGKTIALLSVCVSYHLHYGKKIIYCSRTVSEIQKALDELKKLIIFIKKFRKINFLGVGLASRRNLCINENVINQSDIEKECRLITSEWNMNCPFFNEKIVEDGVFDLDDLREYGISVGTCPYFLARRVLNSADCVIYTYNYLIDPRISDIVCRELSSEAVVIFDEAHNIDNACIEALSYEIKRNTLDNATKCIRFIERELRRGKEKIEEIKNELQVQLKNKLKKNDLEELCKPTQPYLKELESAIDCIPYYYNGKKTQMIPGNMRNSFHFLSILRRLIEFLKSKLKTTHLTTETPTSFCKNIREMTFIDQRTLNYASNRLKALEKSLKLDFNEDLRSLKTVVDFVTLASMYHKGFTIIFEPFDTQAQSVFNPILRLWCVDASIAIKPVFSKFRNVIITSGTLSPIEMYPKILDFVPVVTVQMSTTLERNNISPLIVAKGNDQMTLKTGDLDYNFNNEEDNSHITNFNNETNYIMTQKTENVSKESAMTTVFSLRSEPAVVRNYGVLLQELCKIVPDGIVVFFPSYIYMEEIVSLWSTNKMIYTFKKLVFIESPDFKETSQALINYKKAIDSGRGGILLCVARGKISEGVDFKDQYGRCVVVIGVPFQYTESVRLKKRLEFLREYGIREADFLNFDAMRHAAQCLGRVLRSKRDYGLMIMADSRFIRKDKKLKLPKWILERLDDGNINLSIDMAVGIAKRFFREMAQELPEKGHTFWDENDIINENSKINKSEI